MSTEKTAYAEKDFPLLDVAGALGQGRRDKVYRKVLARAQEIKSLSGCQSVRDILEFWLPTHCPRDIADKLDVSEGLILRWCKCLGVVITPRRPFWKTEKWK